jgi:hypothetical protein
MSPMLPPPYTRSTPRATCTNNRTTHTSVVTACRALVGGVHVCAWVVSGGRTTRPRRFPIYRRCGPRHVDHGTVSECGREEGSGVRTASASTRSRRPGAPRQLATGAAQWARAATPPKLGGGSGRRAAAGAPAGRSRGGRTAPISARAMGWIGRVASKKLGTRPAHGVRGRRMGGGKKGAICRKCSSRQVVAGVFSTATR